MRKDLLLVALLGVSVAVPLACGSKPPPPPVVATDAGAPDANVDAGVDAAPVTSASASATPSASTALPNAADALDMAIDVALKASALKDAAGMQAEGQAGRATLTEGEHFNMIVTLQPNRCYTVLGFSPPGQITQLDLKLMAPPFFNVAAGQSGANDKGAPVLGRGKSALCPILPVPVAYKIDVTAKKGMGRMGVQLFSKSK